MLLISILLEFWSFSAETDKQAKTFTYENSDKQKQRNGGDVRKITEQRRISGGCL